MSSSTSPAPPPPAATEEEAEPETTLPQPKDDSNAPCTMSCSTPTHAAATADEITEGETRWTDDRIRWDDVHDNDNDGGNDDAEEEEGPTFDPFKDPDPTRTFKFQFDGDINIELQGYKAEADEIYKSTGLTLWRASEHLCEYIVQHASLLSANKRILELGAGLGLVGILSYLVAKDSSFCVTDGDTDALVLLRQNVERHTTNDSVDSKDGGRITCRQLLWGRKTSETFLENHCGGKRFDVLVASDIVYSSVVVEPLWETVQVLLRRGGIFLFAYCSWRHVPVTIDCVLKASDEAGFEYEQVDDRDGVLIYIFRWKE